MTLDIEQARDEMSKMARDAWPVDNVMLYDDKPGEVPDGVTPWARLTIRHESGVQATLTDASVKKRFRRTGILTVQIFTPTGEGLSNADKCAKMFLNAFEGKTSPGGVWFRNGRVREIGADGDFFQTNFITDFEYDEIK